MLRKGVMVVAKGQSERMANRAIIEKSTGVMMKRFYANIDKGQSYSEALRGAKIWMITNKENPQPHPYYWAGFVGSGRD